MNRRFALPGLAVLLITALAGCNSSPSPTEGEDVIVQLDRSSLGAATTLPISPTTEAINGADTAIRGKLLSVTEDWVTIETSTTATSTAPVTAPSTTPTVIRHSTIWIPREKILLIQKADAEK